MDDCFDALNALPRSSMRKLVQRIHARKGLAATQGNKDFKKSLDEKYPHRIDT